MRINRTVMVALTLLGIVGLAILSACPQKAPAPDENGVAARPKPVQPAKTPQAPPIEKANPAGPATASFGGLDFFAFGWAKDKHLIICAKPLERAGWERVIAKFNADYGPPADTSTEKDGTTTISWMDAKGRAVSLVESPMTDPDALYKITYQSDTWLR